MFKEGDGYTDGMATTTGWKVWNYDGGKVQRCLRKATGTRLGWQQPQDGLDDILPPGASIELGVNSARLLYKDTCGHLDLVLGCC